MIHEWLHANTYMHARIHAHKQQSRKNHHQDGYEVINVQKKHHKVDDLINRKALLGHVLQSL